MMLCVILKIHREKIKLSGEKKVLKKLLTKRKTYDMISKLPLRNSNKVP